MTYPDALLLTFAVLSRIAQQSGSTVLLFAAFGYAAWLLLRRS